MNESGNSSQEDKVLRIVADSTVGFLLFSVKDGVQNAESAGSGVLVSTGELYGILTAAHVLKFLPGTGEVGILRFPRVSHELQRLSLDMQFTERFLLGEQPWSEFGPDIAFLKLPLKTSGILKSTNTFLSLDNLRERIVQNTNSDLKYAYGVAGVVNEDTERIENRAPNLRTNQYKAKFFDGQLNKLGDESSLDRAALLVNPSNQSKLPSTFAGVSGGGLWRCFVEKDELGKLTVREVRLTGIAFYESDDPCTIICQGQRSVYEIVLPAIKQKWGKS